MKVTLEDGSTIEVPSRRREIKSRQIGPRKPSRFVDEPLPHPDWDFLAILGGYRAYPKERG
jgi:hypothetical protein